MFRHNGGLSHEDGVNKILGNPDLNLCFESAKLFDNFLSLKSDSTLNKYSIFPEIVRVKKEPLTPLTSNFIVKSEVENYDNSNNKHEIIGTFLNEIPSEFPIKEEQDNELKETFSNEILPLRKDNEVVTRSENISIVKNIKNEIFSELVIEKHSIDNIKLEDSVKPFVFGQDTGDSAKIGEYIKEENQPIVNLIRRVKTEIENVNYKTRSQMKKYCSLMSSRLQQNEYLNFESPLQSENYFICNECGVSYKRKNLLAKHIRSKHVLSSKQYFKCSYCFLKFSRKKCLRNHIITDHVAEFSTVDLITRFKHDCKTCCKKIKSRHQVSLFNHDQIIRLPDSLFKCSVCNLTLKNEETVRQHVIGLHKKSFPFQRIRKLKEVESSYMFQSINLVCDTCGHSCETQAKLNKHLKSHDPERPHKCPHCDLKFKKQNHLKNHLLLHENKRQFVCSMCSKKFNRKSYLTMHMLTHKPEREHVCEYCGASYKRKSHCDDHRKKHLHSLRNQHIPFACSVCEKSFINYNEYRRHKIIHNLELQHKKILHFECNECRKVFFTRNSAVTHMHSHLKLYNCDMCGHSFASKFLVARHIKSKHLKGCT